MLDLTGGSPGSRAPCFSHFIKISTLGLPGAEQLRLLTLGDPILQTDPFPARGFMLCGPLGLHLGNLGGPQPARFPRRPEALPLLPEQQALWSGRWTRWAVPGSYLDDGRSKQNVSVVLLQREIQLLEYGRILIEY